MDDSRGPPTSASLLDRLRCVPLDQRAWNDFVERYSRRIYGWCRSRGLQRADAEDVTQDVLLRLARVMRNFAYDPSKRFRAWLRTLTQHAWSDFCKARRHDGGTGDAQTLELLDSLEACADLQQRLDREFDLELLAEARERVRGRVNERTWRAFHLFKVERLSASEVAEKIGLPVAEVFVYAGRVQKMIRHEIHWLDGDRGAAPPSLRNGHEHVSVS